MPMKNIFGSLMVLPTRLSLSDKQKVTTVGLRHLGSKEGKYRISLIFNRMLEDGSLQEIKEPTQEERAALNLIRFSPRIAILQPNVEQVARVMVVAPKSLPPGEYRAHLLFEPTDDTEGEISSIAPTKENKGIGMKLEAKVSVAIPVIYSHGETSFEVKLGSPSLTYSTKGEILLSVPIESSGNAFPRGDLYAFFERPGQPPMELTVTRAFPAYRQSLKFTKVLEKKPIQELKKGILRVEYRELDDGSGSPLKTLASAEIAIP
jgi:hypothetical protein